MLPMHTPRPNVPTLSGIHGQACDIFTCHRGPDVKNNLVGHITERLERANLIVFVDYGMGVGVQSWPHILATLRGARRVLILLTQGFEESPWCLEEARAAAARPDAVIPVFIVDRGDRWSARKLRVAYSKFSTNRDFLHQQCAEEPRLAADIVPHWRKALDSVAQVSYEMHSFKPGRWASLSMIFACLKTLSQCNEQAHDVRLSNAALARMM